MICGKLSNKKENIKFLGGKNEVKENTGYPFWTLTMRDTKTANITFFTSRGRRLEKKEGQPIK